MSENLDALFDAARKLPVEEQRQLAEKLLEAAKESDDTQGVDESRGERWKLRPHLESWHADYVSSADHSAKWNALADLLDDSAVDIDIPDLAHEHDHYLYGKTKKD